MKWFVCSLLLVGTFARAASVEPPRQTGSINCHPSLTLADLFKGGLRPYRTTKHTCDVGKCDLLLMLLGAKTYVPFDASMIGFYINKFDNVSRLDTYTRIMPIPDAVSTMKQLASSINLRLEGLEKDFPVDAADKRVPRVGTTWTQDYKTDWATIRLALEATSTFHFLKVSLFQRPGARVHITVEWNPTQPGYVMREVPIVPPKGFEYVSMEIPKSDLVVKAQTSDSPALAHLRYKDEVTRMAIIRGEPLPEVKPVAATEKVESDGNEFSTVEREDIPAQNSWWVECVVLAAAIRLCWVWFRARRRVSARNSEGPPHP